MKNSVENSMDEVKERRKFGGKTHKNASSSWISSNQNDGATYGIYVTIYNAKNVMETTLKK